MPHGINTLPPLMGAPYPRWASTAFRLSLAIVALTLVGLPVLLMVWMRTPYITNVGVPVSQPVLFDHRHHVVDDGIDCRYCHQTVETSALAGMPSTSVCMNCHNQIWNTSPLLEPVRASAVSGQPIRWRRVHDLPDFVYFNHSIHVNKGIGCVSCHGRVDQMPQTMKDQPLTMSWCLDCHRDPDPNVRPLDRITSMDWAPPGDARNFGAELAQQYGLQHFTNCSICHR
jgi:hypothetical protein